MEAQDPLSELADIHLPADVGFWPPAPGWWVLAALLAIAAFIAARLLLAALLRRRRLGAALRELEESRQRLLQHMVSGRDAAGLRYLNEVNAILRRVALAHYPDSEVAALSGQDWLRWLDAEGGGGDFARGPGKALGEALYRSRFDEDIDADALHRAARRWIERRYQAESLLRPDRREARA